MSAPFLVPAVVTNRTGKRSRAGRVLAICSFAAAFNVMGLRLSPKALLLGRGCWFVGAASEPLPPPSCSQTPLACFVGTLAAVPGCMAMLAHRLSLPVTRGLLPSRCVVCAAFFCERQTHQAVKCSPS